MAADTAQPGTRATLLALYNAAVAAAHPDVCLPPHLPLPPADGRLYVVGAGKAAAAMAVAAEAHYRVLGVLDRVAGFTTAPHGTPEALRVLRAPAIAALAARDPSPAAARNHPVERARRSAAPSRQARHSVG